MSFFGARPATLLRIAALALPLQAHAAFCKNVLAYYNADSKPAYRASDIPYAKISHLCHAFATLNVDGSLQLPAGFVEGALVPSAHAVGTKVLLSVGGAAGSGQFASIAASNTLRFNFAAAVKNFVFNNQYDGVDIDWEFPQNSADRTNFNRLVAAVRATFDGTPNAHPEWLISSAISNDPWTLQWLDLGTLNSSLSFFNLMTYDYHGPWSTHSGDNGPLNPSVGDPHGGAYSAADSVNYLLGQGVSASKINLGLAFYGYQFPVGSLNQTCAASDCSAAFALKYSDIAPLVGAGWTWHWDTQGASPWLSRNAGGQMIAYDDPQSVQAKANWAFNVKILGGVFCWSVDQDYLGPGNQPLVDAMSAPLSCAAPTATFSVTLTRSPTLTLTPTGTPSFSATATRTASPSPTFSSSATVTQTSTKTASSIPTLTATATGTWTLTQTQTSSRTPTPSLTVTQSSTPSFTAVPASSSPSQTVTQTLTATPTLTRSPIAIGTPTLTQTRTATVQSSATKSPSPSMTATVISTSIVTPDFLEVEELLPLPNPGARHLMVKLSAQADEIEIRIYSSAQTLVGIWHAPAGAAGWHQIALDAGLANGLYFALASAKRGPEQCRRSKICKVLILN